ncbi:MAG: hypothetical protein MUD08_16925, partial [Cytophagales bacterium]|nr:hypothetical protein [Cytophagales bacterium]
ALAQAHNAVDSVLRFEQILSKRFPSDKKYSFEQRGAVTQRVYSQAYVDAYHRMLGGQVERQMRAAVRMVRDFWFTCWVDAGQPDLAPLASFAFDAAEADSLERVKRAWENGFFRRVRPHDTGKCDFNSEFGIMNFELKGVLGENSSKHLPVAHAPTRLPRTGRGRDKPVACAKGKFGEAKSGRIFHPLNKRRFGQISPETMNAKRQTVNAKRIALSESSIKLFRNPVMLRTFA